MEKTHRAPPSRTQRAPPGVTTRIAHSCIRSLHRIHSLALTCIATHAAFLTPSYPRLLRLSGIRSLYDNYDPASIRLCWYAGIRSHNDASEPASIRLCWPAAGIRSPSALRHEHEHDYEHELSASIRLC